jgi:hypothetical protein
MQKNWKIGLTTLTLTLVTLTCANAWSARQQKSADAPERASKSAPEMDRLKFYLGEWDYTETYPKSAAYPNGGKNKGLYTSKLGPGGNSLINGFHSKGPVGDFEGLLLITWDPKEKSYKAYVFGNDFPGALVETRKTGKRGVLHHQRCAGSVARKCRSQKTLAASVDAAVISRRSRLSL